MPVSNTLDFIQRYVEINTENDNLRKTEFKINSCSEALMHLEAGRQYCITKSYIYIYIYIYIHSVFIGIPVIYNFPYNSEILVIK